MAENPLYARIAARLAELGISANKASLAAGLGRDAIRNIKRSARCRTDTLIALSRPLKLPPSQLIEVAEIDDDSDVDYDATHNAGFGEPPPGYLGIATLLVSPGMGGFGIDDSELEEFGPPTLMPRTLIEGVLRGAATDFLSMEVDGPSMQPILESGDQVLIDKRKKNPTQAGLFVVFDGHGLAAKWVERVPLSDPPMLRIMSENRRFSEYTVLAEEARIVGRIVWFARRV